MFMGMGQRVRVVGPGRAGTSFATALAAAGWHVEPLVGRSGPLDRAADGVDVVIIATPDAVVAEVAAAIDPSDQTVVLHLSGALGPDPVAGHPRHGVLHPLVALPDGERGAERLVGAWFGLSAAGDPLAERIVADLRGHAIHVDDQHWTRYHAAAVIAANHLVALLGQAERVGASVGLPLEALMGLASGSLRDAAEIGPAAALTGPVSRGDLGTVQRHLDALPHDERDAYRALSEQAARLLPDPDPGADTPVPDLEAST
jgi:predicted short-subunit dehydrogenase-like oxidoreductase (DUF2520 family)